MFNKIFLCIVICAVCSFGQVVTTKKVQKAEGLGVGSTRVEAVNEAISEAVGQIEGVRIKKQSLLENSEIQNDDGSSMSTQYSSKINKITNGKADSYKILSVNNRADGMYEAKVLVTNTKTTKKYKLAGMDNKRRSIAVIPTPTQAGEVLTQELVSALTKTRKFNILDRDNMDAYLSEKKLILSGNTPQDELLKLGNVMGADYLVVSKLRELKEIKKEPNKYISNFNSGYSYEVNAIVEYRLIATATRQVKWSNTVNEKYSINADTPNDAVFQALNKVAVAITTQLLGNIYPIVIIDTTSDEVTLNQGSLEIGDKYDIFTLGKKMYDPYTKESLGQQESKTGTIEIVRSTAKYSTGKIIDGTATAKSVVRKSLSNATKKVNKIKRELPY